GKCFRAEEPFCVASERGPMQQFDFGFAATSGTATRARAKAREADWRRQLARAFVYATGQSPGEAAELVAEYERHNGGGSLRRRLDQRACHEERRMGQHPAKKQSQRSDLLQPLSLPCPQQGRTVLQPDQAMPPGRDTLRQTRR